MTGWSALSDRQVSTNEAGTIFSDQSFPSWAGTSGSPTRWTDGISVASSSGLPMSRLAMRRDFHGSGAAASSSDGGRWSGFPQPGGYQGTNCGRVCFSCVAVQISLQWTSFLQFRCSAGVPHARFAVQTLLH